MARPTDKAVATALALSKLKPQFGKLAHGVRAEGPVIIDFPGQDFPVQIYPFEAAPGSVLRICCPVCRNADWSNGLANFLLSESSDLLIGSIARRGDGITVEQSMIGDVETDELASTVYSIADRASRLRRELTVMGALTTAENVSPEEDSESDS